MDINSWLENGTQIATIIMMAYYIIKREQDHKLEKAEIRAVYQAQIKEERTTYQAIMTEERMERQEIIGELSEVVKTNTQAIISITEVIRNESITIGLDG